MNYPGKEIYSPRERRFHLSAAESQTAAAAALTDFFQNAATLKANGTYTGQVEFLKTQFGSQTLQVTPLLVAYERGRAYQEKMGDEIMGQPRTTLIEKVREHVAEKTTDTAAQEVVTALSISYLLWLGSKTRVSDGDIPEACRYVSWCLLPDASLEEVVAVGLAGEKFHTLGDLTDDDCVPIVLADYFTASVKTQGARRKTGLTQLLERKSPRAAKLITAWDFWHNEQALDIEMDVQAARCLFDSARLSVTLMADKKTTIDLLASIILYRVAQRDPRFDMQTLLAESKELLSKFSLTDGGFDRIRLPYVIAAVLSGDVELQVNLTQQSLSLPPLYAYRN